MHRQTCPPLGHPASPGCLAGAPQTGTRTQETAHTNQGLSFPAIGVTLARVHERQKSPQGSWDTSYTCNLERGSVAVSLQAQKAPLSWYHTPTTVTWPPDQWPWKAPPPTLAQTLWQQRWKCYYSSTSVSIPKKEHIWKCLCLLRVYWSRDFLLFT